MNNNITILFQGKLFPETESYIKKYKDLGFAVYLSTYSESDTFADKVILTDITDIDKLVTIKTGTTHSAKYQIVSTLSGLKEINTSYVIKLRSDEYYTLDKIINLFLSNPDKVITHNLFFRPAKPVWGNYHISDKIILGKTENLIGMFSTAFDIITNKIKINYEPRCAEDLLGYSYLHFKQNVDTNSFSNINNYFDFINFTDASPFCMKFNSITTEIYKENTTLPEFNNRLWIDVVKDTADILWKYT